ncbi:P-loop containing nucleoside triphosphate hydrolase protein [Aspergillus insuetus]
MANHRYYDYNCIPTDIDRRKCQRSVSMDILALGMSRTGTDSLKQALLILGYHDVYHGYSAALDNPRDYEMWLAGLRAKYDGIGKPFGRLEFDQLLGHCQVVSDLPAICFSEELIAAYPKAKVILTTRDLDKWHASMQKTFQPLLDSRFVRVLEMIDRALFGKTRWIGRSWRTIWKNVFDGDFEKNGRQAYRDHYALVEKLVPRGSLLLFDVHDGWEPLCRFLGRPLPQIDFPTGNVVETFHRRLASGVSAMFYIHVARLSKGLLLLSLLYLVLVRTGL